MSSMNQERSVPAKITLRELRARYRLTQKQVAESVGITTKTYNFLENNPSGLLNCKCETVFNLASLFGVSMEEIFLGNNVNKIHIGNFN